MQKFVYSLRDAPDDAAIVGGKAAGLSRLIRYGAPVQPGFVLSAGVYRTVVDGNGLAAGRVGAGRMCPGAGAPWRGRGPATNCARPLGLGKNSGG